MGSKKNIVVILLLTLIFSIGIFLRVYNLDGSPPSLNYDEVAWGYNAYSVMKTGRDEYRTFLPIFTRSFDEYKSTLPLYLMIPTIKIFGLNAIAVRLPSAIVGSLTIILIYLLVKKVFNSSSLGLLSAFLLAIEPWAVHFSRVYYDANEALFFLVLGILLFIYSEKKTFFLPFSALSFVISIYTYNSNKLIVPVFLVVILFLYKKMLLKMPKKILLISSCILFFSGLLFTILALQGIALARVGSTNILRVWDGDVWHFINAIIGRYTAYFSPANLFVREPLEPSTVVPGLSLFLPFEFFGFIVGIFVFIKSRVVPKFLKILLFLGPLPSAVTWNWFQPGRGLTIFFLYTICIAVGFTYLLSFVKQHSIRYFMFSILIIWITINIVLVFNAVNIQLPALIAGNWQPGFQETVPEVMKLAATADRVIVDTPQGQPYIFYLFYGQYDPLKYQRELSLLEIGTPRHSFNFGKFEFREITKEDEKLKNTVLVVAKERPEYYDFNENEVQSIQEILSKDNNYPIYRIIYTKL